MIVLSKKQVLLLHAQLLEESGGSDGLRDEGLLDSALSAPFQGFGARMLFLLSNKRQRVLATAL